MYFLKQAFSKNNEKSEQNFYTTEKFRSTSRGETPGSDNDSGGRTPMSLLKSRRTSNKKLKLKKDQKTPFGNTARGDQNMSCDIKSLLDSFK